MQHGGRQDGEEWEEDEEKELWDIFTVIYYNTASITAMFHSKGEKGSTSECVAWPQEVSTCIVMGIFKIYHT